MIGLGTILNVAAILTGGLLGLLGKKALPPRMTESIMPVLGIFTAVVGLRMLWPGEALLSALISLVAGGLIGEGLRIEDRLQAASEHRLRRFTRDGSSAAQGFLAASVLFCIGPMAILGSISDGLSGNFRLLALKSLLDGISAIPLAAAMGGGVLLSAMPVLVIQGLLTLGAGFLRPLQEGLILTGLNTVGGFLILAIGFTLMGVKKFSVANLLPALLVQVLLAAVGFKY